MKLQDKACIVTGAASGIGEQAALLFAAEGGKVLVADSNAAGAERVAKAITEGGGSARALATDVTRAEDCERMVAECERAFGGLHVLFNNAGIFPAEDNTPEDTPIETWDRVMTVNLKSVFLGCRFGIPALRRSGGGSIINTASFVALMGSAASQVAYTASKGGVLAFTREVAMIYARENIRANALCPGPVDTPLLQQLLAAPQARARRMIHIPMGRLAQAAEVARAALFLASDDSSYVNGTSFTVDGGITSAYITPE